MAISKFWLNVFGEMVGLEGGFVALQSLLIDYEKGHYSFQFSIEWALLEVVTTTNGHLKISIRCISGKYEVCVGGGGPTLRSLWISKRTLKLLLINPIGPSPKLIRSPFLYKRLMPQGHNLVLVLRAVAGCHPQRHNFRTFQLHWTKWLSRIFDQMCWKKWRALPPITLDY